MRRRRISLGLTALGLTGLVLAGVMATGARAGHAEQGDSTLLTCDLADSRVAITASSHLDPGCVWTGGFDITASDVIFDCQGATVRGSGGGRGIEISTPIDADLHRVTVRNCRIEGFLNSVRATRIGFRTLAEGEEYDHELADVVLEGNEFRDSIGVGVFVDGYVSRVTIRDNLITGAGSAGIYLETGSRRNVVDGNTIIDNGFRENGPGGQIEEIAGIRFRWWGAGREGLAIDGSWENVVTGNHFEGNSHGGILLYTNCGEFPDSGRWFDRRWPADRNRIEGNTFVGGLNGVWVGQRMAENTFPMECTKPPYVTGPLRSITLDFAADNVVRGNTFTDVTYGIRVEDDGTVVEGNTFVGSGPDQHAVVIGTPDRTAVLGRPVARTALVDNHADIEGNTDPFRWIHGYDGLDVRGNTAHGAPVGICEGAPLPRLPLIWVIAFAPEPEGSPVTPPPDDLSHPVVGALDPCHRPDPPRVIPGATWVVEGEDEVAVVPLRLSHAHDRTVTVNWTTPVLDVAGLARAGEDFVESSGTVTFDPGELEASVEIPLLEDKGQDDKGEKEGDEILVVVFRDPVDAVMGGFYGLGLGFVADAPPSD